MSHPAGACRSGAELLAIASSVAHLELDPPCSAVSTRRAQGFAHACPTSKFQRLLVPLFPFLFLLGRAQLSPAERISVLFWPEKGACCICVPDRPYHLLAALFGFSFPVLLICWLEETDFFTPAASILVCR